MGGCFSLLLNINSQKDDKFCAPAASIITISGEFRQFNVPITVSQVLQQIESPSTEFFICNSDSLYYDEHIPALNSDHELQSAQIYFVLPNSKLKYPLSASEMAALAVKASLALSSQNSNDRQTSKKRRCRISPVLSVEANQKVVQTSLLSYDVHVEKRKGSSDKQSEFGVSRSSSIRKLQRYSSRRVIKLAARSFRLRLKTIYEGSDVQF